MTKNYSKHIAPAELTWDENGVPTSSAFGDIYFSKANGEEEVHHVFINANELPQRWRELANGDAFVIGETGFGTGLNFLIAWQLWSEYAPKDSRLQFLSVEKHPLSRQDLQRALSAWSQLQPFCQQLIDAYPPQPLTGLHKLNFCYANKNVELCLFFGEAHEGFSELAAISLPGPKLAAQDFALGTKPATVDAWFFDGFAPSKNPAMWSAELFTSLANLSGTGTTFATFTAAGVVKRGMAEAGFIYEKIPGYGRKREMLKGHFDNEKASEPVDDEAQKHHSTQPAASELNYKLNYKRYKQSKIRAESSWHLVSNSNSSTVKHCAIIGAGLAGCHTANALARKNIQVTLIDRHGEVASEASGNRQAVVYTKLSPHHDALSEFNLIAQLYANRLYHKHGFYNNCGEACGVMHLATTAKQAELYRQFGERYVDEAHFAKWLRAEDCKAISGLASDFPALFLPHSGWLSPQKVCQQLIQHKNITLVREHEIAALNWQQKQWALVDNEGHSVCNADAVVIANAERAKALTQSHYLPLKRIRGQVTHIDSSAQSAQLKTVLCGHGYITPAHEGSHTCGATFNLTSDDSRINQADHIENLEALAELSSELGMLQHLEKPEQLTGRVAFRCATPDYFPIAGPVANAEAMKETFGFIRKKANAVIDAPGEYYPNLYCNLGHGSRGVCYTPLCSDLIASLITGDFLPMNRSMYLHVHPARFLMRDLARNRI